MDSEVGQVSNFDAQSRQKRNLAIAMALMIILITFFIGYSFFKMKHRDSTSSPRVESIKVSALSAEIEDSSIGLQRLEKKLKEYEAKLTVDKEPQSFEPDSNVIFDLEEKIQALERKIEEMERFSTQPSISVKPDREDIREDLPMASFPSSTPSMHKVVYTQNGELEKAYPNQIQIDSFKAMGDKPKTASNYIPSGTYVKALLIQGIDASASISSQSDPRPVLMRLTSNGSLPNEVSTHIEDCRIIGAAYGDISSERAYIRLESMSCTLKSKAIIESVVDGYIVGEDGKAGIRGIVVRREANLLTNSFFSGLASGLGSGLSDSFDRDLVSPLGIVSETKSSDVFKKAGAQGISNSFERLSKYYIERAEQFQPVIQIGAGREIDVVFKKGFHLHEGSQPLALAQDR